MKNRVDWSLIVDSEIITEYAGVTFKDYYTSPRVMLKAQLKAREIFEKLYNVGHLVPTGAYYESYVEATLLGVKLVFSECTQPWAKKPLYLFENGIAGISNAGIGCMDLVPELNKFAARPSHVNIDNYKN